MYSHPANINWTNRNIYFPAHKKVQWWISLWIIFSMLGFFNHNTNLNILDSSSLKVRFSFEIPLITCRYGIVYKRSCNIINHEVSETERKHFHKKLIGIIILLNFIILLLWAFKMTLVFNCISIVILFCSISHVACTIGKNKELYY